MFLNDLIEVLVFRTAGVKRHKERRGKSAQKKARTPLEMSGPKTNDETELVGERGLLHDALQPPVVGQNSPQHLVVVLAISEERSPQ